MEKKSGQKLCSFSSIYQMKEEKDIPYSLPDGMSKEWYIEFYTVACSIFRKTNRERYEVCFSKLMELCNETK
jgi:hypothetical protein